MKKSNVIVPFDDEKVKAIHLYAGKKSISVEAELEDCLQKIYEKYVPKDTREYIDLISDGQPAKPKPRPTTQKAEPPAAKPGTAAPASAGNTPAKPSGSGQPAGTGG